MKFTLSWIMEHLETTATAEQIGEALTAIGLELEQITDPAAALAPFRIAKVVEAAPHPNADKLRVLRVDAGTGALFQVVCGAPNARAGMVGVFAPPGAFVPGPAFAIKATRIRDVESVGMMCSEKELLLGEDHDGIIDLPADAPVGTAYAAYAGLDDPLFDISVTPNRPDCMGVRGIARDLAAYGIGTLKPLAVPVIEGAADGPDVRTDDGDGCPAFHARTVRGVTNGASPGWMQARLKAVGQRPISALVDITNYVMIDLGRPLHVYDMARLHGPLIAREARDGEELAALNGKTYRLEAGMTVIADDAMVHDIGGIMGGAHSGASADTADVLIECAYFDPDAIARTGLALNLTSDARQRFERGVDPAFLDDGLTIATDYVLRLCGGTASAVTRAGAAPAAPRIIAFDPARTATLGGINIDADTQAGILLRLGFAVGRTAAAWRVIVPGWRRDVQLAEHLVSEVIRIHGLAHVPSVPLPRRAGVAAPTATPMQMAERRLRRTAAARGLHEAVTWSFLAQADVEAVGVTADWTLANPISEELKIMRPSLLPGLLAAARRNIDRGAASVRLFELGRCYFAASDGTSDERRTLALVLVGEAQPRDWAAGRASGFDAFAAKAEVEALLANIGVETDRLMVMGFDNAGPDGRGPDGRGLDGRGVDGGHYHPGQSATLRLGPKTVLAAFGALHPRVARAFDLKGPVMAAEIYLDALPLRRAASPARPAYTPPVLQPVTRDFAFLVAAALPAIDLVRAVRGADKPHIAAARLFDRFVGDGVPEGQVSLAIEVTLQPQAKSFDEAALAAISAKIVGAAAKLGAKLRL